MAEKKSNKLTVTVSTRFFESNVYTHIVCPLCGKRTKVLVSILSVEKCDNCKQTIEVEFKEH